MDDDIKALRIEQTAALVAIFVANNSVLPTAVADLIASVYGGLSSLGRAVRDSPSAASPDAARAVTIRKSLASRDHILSMIDGKPYVSLKRHLAARGLTPADYRERFNLPFDYPMVAAAYSERRSAMAKARGFGRKPGTKMPPKSVPPAAKRGRPPKAIAPVETPA